MISCGLWLYWDSYGTVLKKVRSESSRIIRKCSNIGKEHYSLAFSQIAMIFFLILRTPGFKLLWIVSFGWLLGLVYSLSLPLAPLTIQEMFVCHSEGGGHMWGVVNSSKPYQRRSRWGFLLWVEVVDWSVLSLLSPAQFSSDFLLFQLC